MNKDDKIALVGANEMAKTTLFKILIGEMEPDSGYISSGESQRPKLIFQKITPSSLKTAI